MAKHGKKYLAAAEKVDRNHNYDPGEAIALAKETSTTNFDATVELHIRLGVDPRHADQQVRDVVVLPHGLGKSVRVLVFAQGEGATLARDAGATPFQSPDAWRQTLAGRDLSHVRAADLLAIVTPDRSGHPPGLGRTHSLSPGPLWTCRPSLHHYQIPYHDHQRGAGRSGALVRTG